METALVILALTTAFFAVVAAVLYRRGRPRGQTHLHPLVESMKTIGELSVYRIVLREIVTHEDHAFGSFGSKYLRWLMSTKKIALVFQFDIEFRYDLRSEFFAITEEGAGGYCIHLPPCTYVPYTRRLRFYDEQNAKFIPWLLPGLLAEFLGGGRFTEQDKNRLISEAEASAVALAADAVNRHQSDIRASAQRTLSSVARAFGAEHITFAFASEQPPAIRVDFEPEQKSGAML